MVYYDLVAKRSRWYSFDRWLVGHFYKYIYYRKVCVRGRENLPPSGTPMLLVGNHQNGLMDALGILFGLPAVHIPIFLARADIFKNPKVAKVLSFFKILPVFRQRDGKEHLEENQEIFDFSARCIGSGFVLTLFPEGQHQEGHYLGKIKKGFARIAFDAAEKFGFPADMVVVPVGNHYEAYQGYRKEVLLTFGRPILLADYYDLYKENPIKAMLGLSNSVEESLQTLILDLPYKEQYQEVDRLREMLRPPRLGNSTSRFIADKLFADDLRAMPASKFQSLCEQAHKLEDQMKSWGFTEREWPVDYTRKDLFEKFLCLLVFSPFAFFGWITHLLPFWISEKKAKDLAKSAGTEMLFTTFHFVLDLLLTIAFYLLYLLVFLLFVTPSFFVGLELVIALLIGRVAYTEYRPLLKSLWRQCLAYRHRKDVDFLANFQSLRRETSACKEPETTS